MEFPKAGSEDGNEESRPAEERHRSIVVDAMEISSSGKRLPRSKKTSLGTNAKGTAASNNPIASKRAGTGFLLTENLPAFGEDLPDDIRPKETADSNEVEDKRVEDESDRIRQELQQFLDQRAPLDGSSSETNEGDKESECEEPSVLWECGSGDDVRSPGAAPMDSEDNEAQRQHMLRKVAKHDSIGGHYIPQAQPPTQLIAMLEKRKEDIIYHAKTLRAPYEKFQDFDTFIDELTITDDQSWKTIELRKDTPKLPQKR